MAQARYIDRFRLVELTATGWQVSEFTKAELLPAMEARGYKFAGLNRSPHNRAELQGQPIFQGVLGPMWDGNAIRYEGKKANEALSL